MLGKLSKQDSLLMHQNFYKTQLHSQKRTHYLN